MENINKFTNYYIVNEKFASFKTDKQNITIHFDELNLKVYTNKQLKLDLIDILDKQPQTSSIILKLKKYIENDILIPVRYNSAFFKHLLFRTKVFFIDDLLGVSSNSNFQKRAIGGFYDPSMKKIFILIDNNVNLFNFTNDFALAQLILHEFAHYINDNSNKQFKSKFDAITLKFYSVLYSKYLSLDVKRNSKYIIDICDKLKLYSYDLEDVKLKKIQSEKELKNLLMNYFKIAEQLKEYSSLDEVEFKERLDIFYSYIIHAMLNPMVIMKNFTAFKEIYYSFLYSYVSGLKVPKKYIHNTLFYQEIIFPSEIVAVSSIKSEITKELGSMM